MVHNVLVQNIHETTRNNRLGNQVLIVNYVERLNTGTYEPPLAFESVHLRASAIAIISTSNSSMADRLARDAEMRR